MLSICTMVLHQANGFLIFLIQFAYDLIFNLMDYILKKKNG